jgi:hypothetical protein
MDHDFICHLRRSRFWFGLILYWLVSGIGATLLFRSYASLIEPLWVIICMIIFISVCMIYDRGQWNIWQRVGFVFVSVIVQALISYPLMSLQNYFYHIPVIRYVILFSSFFFIASLFFVVFAMLRSSLFVKSEDSF